MVVLVILILDYIISLFVMYFMIISCIPFYAENFLRSLAIPKMKLLMMLSIIVGYSILRIKPIIGIIFTIIFELLFLRYYFSEKRYYLRNDNKSLLVRIMYFYKISENLFNV